MSSCLRIEFSMIEKRQTNSCSDFDKKKIENSNGDFFRDNGLQNIDAMSFY